MAELARVADAEDHAEVEVGEEAQREEADDEAVVPVDKNLLFSFE